MEDIIDAEIIDEDDNMEDRASPNPDEQTETPQEEPDLQIDEEILTDSDDSEVIALAGKHFIRSSAYPSRF